MGLLTTLVLERKVKGKWNNLGDLFDPLSHEMVRGKRSGVPRDTISYNTIGHNGLIWAHLLGAFNVTSLSDAPDSLDDGLRIAGKYRNIPTDADPVTVKAIGSRDHMGADATPSFCTLKEILPFNWTQPILHRFWINGPMAFRWATTNYSGMPEQYELYYHTNDCPINDRDGLVVELETLQKLVDKVLHSGGDGEDHARRITAWGEHQWAFVEREFCLLEHTHDFLGKIVGQLIDGSDPNNSRVICWVS